MRARRLLLLLPAVLALGLPPGTAGARAAGPVTITAAAVDTTMNPAATSWGTDRIDVFAKGIDGTLLHKVYNGRWSDWESLGGSITSGPAAVSWGPGRIDVFARSSSGSVVHRWFAGGKWEAWESLGGGTIGAPAVSSWGSNRLDVFVRGTDNRMYHKAFNGSWSTSWASLGGTFSSAPAAVSWATNRIDVFGRGGSNALYHKYWVPGGWATTWENLGGSISSNPAVVSGSSGFLTIFARNPSNVITTKGWGFGQWSGWTTLDGTVANAPAASEWGASHTDLFSFNSSGVLLQRTWNGIFGWTPWAPVPVTGAAVPPAAYSPTVAVQVDSAAPADPLAYAYVDNIGRIVHGYQPEPANVFSVQWTVISLNDAFTGPPGLVALAGGKLQLSAQHASSDVWARETVAGSGTWTGWLSRGGLLGPASVRAVQQVDGTVVLLALDPAGGLWSLAQPSLTGDYRTWKYLGVGGLSALPTAVAGQDGLKLFAIDTLGSMRTATLFPNGNFSAWVSLGSPGLTGTPAAIVAPGFRVRLFARTTTGSVVTMMQDASLAWPATWSTVAGPTLLAGSPAAVLSPQSGKAEVVVRGVDNNIYSSGETVQGSGVWRAWTAVLFPPDVAATDPTVLTFNNGAGLTWAFLFRTADQQSRMYTVESSGLSALSTVDLPAFTAHRLPAPPT